MLIKCRSSSIQKPGVSRRDEREREEREERKKLRKIADDQVMSLFQNLKTKMVEVGYFLEENKINITSTSVSYRRKFTLRSQKWYLEQWSICFERCSYHDVQRQKWCTSCWWNILLKWSRDSKEDMKSACHVKLVISDDMTIYVSAELFLLTGTHTSNLSKGFFHTKCEKLIMLNSFSIK